MASFDFPDPVTPNMMMMGKSVLDIASNLMDLELNLLIKYFMNPIHNSMNIALYACLSESMDYLIESQIEFSDPVINGQEIDEYRDEEDIDLITAQMQEMGLPLEFSSTKSQIKRNERKKKFKIDDPSVDQQRKKSKKKSYYYRRYSLFSRFDEGIILDEESWYSVTPEEIAKHIAKRCIKEQTTVIIDGFCGAGGNTIQFALASPSVRVLAIDIDPEKIEMAHNNALIYGVDQQVDFIVGDYMNLINCDGLKADVVFLSPPWGGPNYLSNEVYTLDLMTPNGKEIIKSTMEKITNNIAFLLPRNINESELIECAGDNCFVEIEKNILDKKVKTVTAYFGDLIKSND